MLCVQESPHTAAGRALLRGKLFDAKSGELVASTVQEAVFRRASPPSSKL
jgi:acyl-CoA thioesterase